MWVLVSRATTGLATQLPSWCKLPDSCKPTAGSGIQVLVSRLSVSYGAK